MAVATTVAVGTGGRGASAVVTAGEVVTAGAGRGRGASGLLSACHPNHPPAATAAATAIHQGPRPFPGAPASVLAAGSGVSFDSSSRAGDAATALAFFFREGLVLG